METLKVYLGEDVGWVDKREADKLGEMFLYSMDKYIMPNVECSCGCRDFVVSYIPYPYTGWH